MHHERLHGRINMSNIFINICVYFLYVYTYIHACIHTYLGGIVAGYGMWHPFLRSIWSSRLAAHGLTAWKAGKPVAYVLAMSCFESIKCHFGIWWPLLLRRPCFPGGPLTFPCTPPIELALHRFRQ